MAREIFDKIDVDGSGSITADELALLARRYVGPFVRPPMQLQLQKIIGLDLHSGSIYVWYDAGLGSHLRGLRW